MRRPLNRKDVRMPSDTVTYLIGFLAPESLFQGEIGRLCGFFCDLSGDKQYKESDLFSSFEFYTFGSQRQICCEQVTNTIKDLVALSLLKVMPPDMDLIQVTKDLTDLTARNAPNIFTEHEIGLLKGGAEMFRRILVVKSVTQSIK